MNLRDYVDGLECRRVYPGDEDILNNLQDFKCGDPKDFRTVVSESMLDRLTQYINGEAEKNGRHDIYYVIMDKSVVLFFFSLQTGQVYNTDLLRLEDEGKLCFCANAIPELDNGITPQEQLEAFQSTMEYSGLDYDYRDPAVARMLLDTVLSIIETQSKIRQNDLYASATFPCIELVNFCKNLEANEIWEDNNFLPAVGATLFWLKILPIIEEVSDKVGCKYVSLFAADKSKPGDNEKLVSYYGNALKFERPKKLNTIKPKYDWECVFLCQEIKVLSNYKMQFIQDYLDVDSDEV